MSSRLRRYVEEFAFAVRSAEGFSKVRFPIDTLAFHDSQILPGKTRSSRPVRHRLRLGSAPSDVWLRTVGGDLFVFYEVFLDGEYALPDWKGRTGLRIVDLGANVGVTSLYYHHAFPSSEFFCVEPHPANLQVLEKNLKDVRARILRGAAGGTRGRMNFDGDAAAWGGSLKDGGTLQVEVYSLANVLEAAGFPEVDLLKVDIEGAEKDLFKDAGALQRVKRIVIELHEGYTHDHLRGDLEPHGFRVYPPLTAPFANRMTVAVRV